MRESGESPVTREWLAIARKDWRRVGRNLRDRDVEAAAFFLQQALEKYLKAFLLSHQWRLIKIHELDALLDHAAKIKKAAREFVKTMFPNERLSR